MPEPRVDWLYEKVLKPLLFHLDPEWIHRQTVNIGGFLGQTGLGRGFLRLLYPPVNDPVLKTDLAGIPLANPIGLGAGFDKEGRLPRTLAAVGFGFMEIGSVTGQPCPGNPGTRLWRLPEDRALVVNYGLLSSGADNISRGLTTDLKRGPWPLPVGISVAKANLPHLKGAAGLDDYIMAFKKMEPFASYVTVNVSCPNINDALYCENPELYRELLARLDAVAPNKPVFFKLSPDLTQARLLEIFEQTAPYAWAKGFILTNLTHDRTGLTSPNLAKAVKGGIGGSAGLRDKADATLKFAAQNARQRFIFIGGGGIDSVDDAYRKIKLGASALQIVTSLIYRGPGWPRQLALGLAKKLRADGFKSVREAVGAGL